MPKETDLKLQIRTDGAFFVQLNDAQFTIGPDEDFAVFTAYLEGEEGPVAPEIQVPIETAQDLVTAALTGLEYFNRAPRRSKVYNPNDVFAIYIDSVGEEHKQLISDINEVGILIDPETGDDLDIIRIETH